MSQLKHITNLASANPSNTYRMVRAGFVAQGTTLNRWCIANGISRQTAEKALKGERVNRNSSVLVERLVKAALPEGEHGA